MACRWRSRPAVVRAIAAASRPFTNITCSCGSPRAARHWMQGGSIVMESAATLKPRELGLGVWPGPMTCSEAVSPFSRVADALDGYPGSSVSGNRRAYPDGLCAEQQWAVEVTRRQPGLSKRGLASSGRLTVGAYGAASETTRNLRFITSGPGGFEQFVDCREQQFQSFVQILRLISADCILAPQAEDGSPGIGMT